MTTTGDVIADGDFDGDGEQNAALTPPDCDMRRSLTNADAPVECLAWCNKVELVGGLDTTSEDCLRDCPRDDLRTFSRQHAAHRKLLVVTSKQSFETPATGATSRPICNNIVWRWK